LERGLGTRIARQAWRGATTPAPAAPFQREETLPASRPILASPRLRPAWTTTPVVHEASTNAPRERTNAFPRRQSPTARSAQPAAARPAREPRASGPTKGERHEIICSACGKASSVNFEPDYSRPIYCSACHKTRQAARATGAQRSYRGQLAADRS
jgi:CxxC-x17-CxxC domain-containing protein